MIFSRIAPLLAIETADDPVVFDENFPRVAGLNAGLNLYDLYIAKADATAPGAQQFYQTRGKK
jgi:hypothetical protein